MKKNDNGPTTVGTDVYISDGANDVSVNDGVVNIKANEGWDD